MSSIKKVNSLLLVTILGMALLSMIATPLLPLEIKELGHLHANNYEEIIVHDAYAYCLSRVSGIDILDIGDPSNPKIAGHIDLAHTIHINGQYLYSADISTGFQVWDITAPLSPVFRGKCNLPGLETDEATSIFTHGIYAYVTLSGAGLLVIDISAPSSPVHVGALTYEAPCFSRDCEETIYARDVYVTGNKAYIADDTWGLKVVDITEPDAPVLLGELDPHSNLQEIYVRDNYAYMVGGHPGLIVIDVSNPAAPVMAGSYRTPENYTSQDLFIVDQYAYIAYDSAGLHVVDISDPTSPVLAGKYQYGGHFNHIFIGGNHAYLTSDYKIDLHILDISTPPSPTLTGQYDRIDDPKNIYVSGQYAYIADYHGGLRVVDISSLSAPKLIATLDTVDYERDLVVRDHYAYVFGAAYAEPWGGLYVIDISVPSSPTVTGYCPTPGTGLGLDIQGNYVYVADGSKGHALTVIDVSNPASPFAAKTYTAANAGNALARNVSVKENYAYLAYEECGLQIVDLSNPAVLTKASEYKFPGEKITDVKVKGSHVYLVSRQKGLIIMDVTIPELPALEGRLDIPISWEADLGIYGDYAFLAANGNCLYVVDISNPTSPSIVQHFKYEPELKWASGLFVTPGHIFLADVYAFYCFSWQKAQAEPVTLTVAASPNPGVPITVEPADKNNNSNGATTFTRTYDKSTIVTLTAPAAHGGLRFLKWKIRDKERTSPSVRVTLDTDTKATAVYSGDPVLELNRSDIYFGADTGGKTTGAQSLLVSNIGAGAMNWSISSDRDWLTCSPLNGSDNEIVSVSVNAGGLNSGAYTGTLTVSSVQAANGSQQVRVTLNVYRSGESDRPFGIFATPLDGAGVCGSIPVTGWVLDDIGVESVKIYREEKDGQAYIGDAVFVEGARPDVELYYPAYPGNRRAGWGYMMLTHFLPGGGNGTYKITAIAADIEGNRVSLGSKTITCNNRDAIKPFGAIDTPTQGGIASGGKYLNWGWVLTPRPNSVPIDGSTIHVWVDGVKIGNPTYNLYRSDIATLFPDYANSQGAVGYLYLDTTSYQNGVHTIQWTAGDDAGNNDGIGSRYFTIQNTTQPGSSTSAAFSRLSQLDELPMDRSMPQQVDVQSRLRVPAGVNALDEEGNPRITVKELERIALRFSLSPEETVSAGYLVVDGQLRSLPTGSTLDGDNGTFYWQPGSGFLGDYRFVFLVQSPTGDLTRKMLRIRITPKHPVNGR
jgi:hypothetical protein